MLAIKNMQEAATLGRDAALEVEAQVFRAGGGDTAGDRADRRVPGRSGGEKGGRAWEKKGSKQIGQAAVLGAGIMGGGIAYQSAVQRHADPHEGHQRARASTLGLTEAGKLLVEAG